LLEANESLSSGIEGRGEKGAPIRGSNPRPSSGWHWSLSDYEVLYVEAYRVRPPRDETWLGTSIDEARLDAEAAGIIREKSKKAKRGTYRLSLLLAYCAIFLVIGAILLSFAVINYVRADGIRLDTISVEEQLND
jgi:hypothetical protein